MDTYGKVMGDRAGDRSAAMKEILVQQSSAAKYHLFDSSGKIGFCH